MLKSLVTSFLTILIFCACHVDKKEDSATEDYKYNLSCSGCNTDDQVFTSKETYCTGLLDESRNKSCCRNMREQMYNQQCK